MDNKVNNNKNKAASFMLAHSTSAIKKLDCGTDDDRTRVVSISDTLNRKNQDNEDLILFNISSDKNSSDESEKSQRSRIENNKMKRMTTHRKPVTVSLTSSDSAEVGLSPINVVYSKPKEVTEGNKFRTLRGKERAQVHSFFKEMRLSNSISSNWDVDKSVKEEIPLVKVDTSFQDDNLVFTNLNDYLKPKPPKSATPRLKSKFSRVSLKDLGAQLSNFQLENISEQSQQSVMIEKPQKATMASTNQELVSASSIASVSAAIDAFIIPMLSQDDFINNTAMLEAFGLSTGLASVNNKYISVNVPVEQKNLAKEFFKGNKLTILNCQNITIFVPKLTAKIQFLVTRKGKAPSPPTIVPVVECGAEPIVIVKPRVKSLKRVKPVVFTEKPVKKIVSPTKQNLDSWMQLSPDQVNKKRKTEVEQIKQHKQEVLASLVKPSISYANTMKDATITETKISYVGSRKDLSKVSKDTLSPKKEKIPEKLAGVPYPLWVKIWSQKDLIEGWYKKLFRTMFFTYRSRWNIHSAICVKTKRPIDMNPYLMDFNYMWKYITSQSTNLRDRYTHIKEWEQKVVAFYPRNAFNADWHKPKSQ